MSLSGQQLAESEELAAYLEGALSPEERRAVEARLATDEAYYETFAQALRFREHRAEPAAEASERRPAPTGPDEPEPAPSEPRRWWPVLLAAGLVGILAAAVWLATRPPATFRASDVTATLDAESLLARRPDGAWSSLGWTEKLSEGYDWLSAEARAFRAGVRRVQLDVALQAENPAEAGRAGGQLAALVDDPWLASDFGSLVSELETDSSARLLRRSRSLRDMILSEYRRASLDGSFRLGEWTEAGRLAAAAGDLDVLADSGWISEGRALQPVAGALRDGLDPASLAAAARDGDPETLERALTLLARQAGDLPASPP